jgi:prepilin-type N-terminal cleavage/methylation domain-containing protein
MGIVYQGRFPWERPFQAAQPAYGGEGASMQRRSQSGFSMVELLVVVSLALLIAGMAIPSLVRAVHGARLRGAGNDLSGILQVCRIRAVQDDRFYSIYLKNTNGLQQEFVDIFPQQLNGTSGSSGNTLDPRDPSIALSSEITRQPQSSAPNTANLVSQLLPTNPNNLQPSDASAAATPFTFGPSGLPCKPGVSAGGTGTICNSTGGTIAYWTFLQDSSSLDWEAVTVTPAGHIQIWYYDAGSSTWKVL